MKVVQNNKPSTYKVTLIGGVHGNEFFGRTVFRYFAKNIEKYPGITLVLANNEALSKRRRGVDGDLNRSFPGNPNGNHEERLAADMLEVIEPNSYIIDIHTTPSKLTMVPIITNLSSGTQQIINHLPNRHIVYMKAGFGSLISQFQNSISLEYNKDYCKELRLIAELETIIHSLLTGELINPKPRQIFTCVGRIEAHVRIPVSAQNFVEIPELGIIPFLPRVRAFRGYKGFSLSKPIEQEI